MQFSHGVLSLVVVGRKVISCTQQREWRDASYWCYGRCLTHGNCAALRQWCVAGSSVGSREKCFFLPPVSRRHLFINSTALGSFVYAKS